MSKTTTDLVREFHAKHRFAVCETLMPIKSQALSAHVNDVAIQLACHADDLMEDVKACGRSELGIERIQLMVEELGELIDAIRRGDLVEVADGLADLAYVVAGTAVAYGVPLEALIDEVHRSNMTKEVGVLNGHKPVKTDAYSPPDIRGVLSR